MYTTLKRKTQLKAKTHLTAKTRLKQKTGLKVRQAYHYKPKPRAKYFSILTGDLSRCYLTGKAPVDIHHIFGASNKKNSEKYGFVVPLIPAMHTGEHGVHFNKELDLKLKRQCQDWWLSHIGTKDDFIKIFGQWW